MPLDAPVTSALFPLSSQATAAFYGPLTWAVNDVT
jgi:hypothetical protein